MYPKPKAVTPKPTYQNRMDHPTVKLVASTVDIVTGCSPFVSIICSCMSACTTPSAPVGNSIPRTREPPRQDSSRISSR